MDLVSFYIPSITCSSCSNKIQTAVQNLSGVSDVNVDLKSQLVNVDYNSQVISPQEIKKQISLLGFAVDQ